MNKGVEKKKIVELVNIYNNIRVPLSSKERECLEKIFPYYGAQGIVDYVDNFLFDGEYILVAEDGENLRSNNQNICNLVSGKFWVNNHAHILKANENNITKYLFYNFNRIKFEPYVTGSAQPKLNKENLLKIETYVHSKVDQQKIVSVLSALDDKIELNNRINAELEQMAKTLYNYWFVQFDFPNTDGKPYKSSGGKMVHSEVLKWEIPEGWKVKSLSEINSELVRGISPKYSDDSGLPVINQRCIRNNTIDFTFCRLHNVQLKPVKKVLELGDILVNSTGVGTLGRVAIVRRLEDPQTTFDSHVTVVRAKFEKVNSTFLGFSLLSRQAEIEMLGEGSTGQTELSRENLGKLKLPLPKRELQNEFELIVKPLWEKIAINEQQNQQLSALRDWLLPMLMNGQVKVDSNGISTNGNLSMQLNHK